MAPNSKSKFNDPLLGFRIVFQRTPVNVAADFVGERPTTRQPAGQGVDEGVIAHPALGLHCR